MSLRPTAILDPVHTGGGPWGGAGVAESTRNIPIPGNGTLIVIPGNGTRRKWDPITIAQFQLAQFQLPNYLQNMQTIEQALPRTPAMLLSDRVRGCD